MEMMPAASQQAGQGRPRLRRSGNCLHRSMALAASAYGLWTAHERFDASMLSEAFVGNIMPHAGGVLTPSSAWRGSLRGPGSSVSRFASAEEDKVLRLTDEYPATADADDKDEVLQAVKKLPKAPSDAYDLLLGQWIVEWSTMGGRASSKAPGGEAKKSQGLPLKLLSFGSLPSVPVQITGSYNQVVDGKAASEKGGRYQLLQTFTMPEFTDSGVEAAMMLEGPWGAGTSQGEWGEGAARTRAQEEGTERVCRRPNRVPIRFETVRLVLSATRTEESLEMLKKAGLAEYVEPKS
ncbi:unnamed protein product, partial [Polarella glacialis]